MKKNSYWWVLLSPAFVILSLLLHFYPSYVYTAMLVLTAGLPIRLGIPYLIQRRRNKNGPLPAS